MTLVGIVTGRAPSIRMRAIDLLVRVRSAARNQVVKREVRKGKLKREVMVFFYNNLMFSEAI